ncbi:hypothetical protein ABW21_db0202063 [Orbilia brochopaga]|nr:hypothetical protein ABW21_db0202063 [Drechslerella brochopaga]
MALLSSSEPLMAELVATDSRPEYLLTGAGSPEISESAALQPASAEPARSRNGNKRNLEGERDTERQDADEWGKQPQENTGRKRRKQQSTGTAATVENSISLPISSVSLETSGDTTKPVASEIQQDDALENDESSTVKRKRQTVKTPVISSARTRPRRSTTARRQDTQLDGRFCLSSDSAFVETSPYFSESMSTSRRSSRSRTKTLLSIPAPGDMVVPGTPEVQRRIEHIDGLDVELDPSHGMDNSRGDLTRKAYPYQVAAQLRSIAQDRSPTDLAHSSSPTSMTPVQPSRRGGPEAHKQEPDAERYKDFDFSEYTRYVFSKDKGTVSVDQAIENIRNHGKWNGSSAVEKSSDGDEGTVAASLNQEPPTGSSAKSLPNDVVEALKDTEKEDRHHHHKDRKRKSKKDSSKSKSKDEKRKKRKKKDADRKDGEEQKDADPEKKKKRHHRKDRKHEGDHEERRSRRKERKREREKLKEEEEAQLKEAGHQSDVPAVGTEPSNGNNLEEAGPDDEAASSTPVEDLVSESKSYSRKSRSSSAKKSSKASPVRITVAIPAPGDGEQMADGTALVSEVEGAGIALAENLKPRKRGVNEIATSDLEKIRSNAIRVEGLDTDEYSENQEKEINGSEEYQPQQDLLWEESEVKEVRRTPRKSARGSVIPKSTSASPSKRIPAGTSIIVPPPLDAPVFGLIQEEVRNNPYHLLVAVIFLQKTKGSSAIPVYRDFIAKWPTPQELLLNGSEEEVRQWFVSLGLQTTRARSVWNIASHFSRIDPDDQLHGPDRWIPRSDYVPEDPTGSKRKWGCTIGSIPGCGKYAIDSWRIFSMKPGEGGFLDGTTVGSRRKQEIASDQESLPVVVYPPEFAPGDEEWRRIPVDDPKLDKELKAYVQWMHAKDAAGFGTARSTLVLHDRDAEGEPDDMSEHGTSLSFV